MQFRRRMSVVGPMLPPHADIPSNRLIHRRATYTSNALLWVTYGSVRIYRRETVVSLPSLTECRFRASSKKHETFFVGSLTSAGMSPAALVFPPFDVCPCSRAVRLR